MKDDVPQKRNLQDMKIALGFRWLSILLLGMVSGCATMVGTWESTSLYPEMARDQFRLIRSDNATGDFLQAKVSFDKDGKYVAETYHRGGNSLSRGTWEYVNGRLTLNDDELGAHSYAADFGPGGTFRIVQPIKGTDVVLTMTRRK